MWTKNEQLYEGKAKKIWSVNESDDLVIQEFKNDATAFNGEKRGSWSNKGTVNNIVASTLFKYLESHGVKTHFVERLSDNEMLIKRLSIIPLEVIVRNRSAGSFCKRYGAKEGIIFDHPTFEFSYKVDALGDPLINDSHAIALGIATAAEIAVIREAALNVNQLLQTFFLDRGIILVDFKLEYGKHNGEILLGDEISPDTCRFWDAVTGQKMDKDLFRFDLGDVSSAYATMLEKVTS